MGQVAGSALGFALIEFRSRHIRLLVVTAEVLRRIESNKVAFGGRCESAGSLQIDVVPNVLDGPGRIGRMHDTRVQQCVQ